MVPGDTLFRGTLRSNIAVYCARSWLVSTLFTTRATRIFTSPPATAANLNIQNLYAPIVYIRLHGIDGQPYLYGDPGFVTALRLDQVASADFPGSIVFLEGCHGADFAGAFLQAGARSVVGNTEPTFGRKWFLGPSSIVGRAWLNGVLDGLSAKDALKSAGDEFLTGWHIYGETEAKIS